MIFTWYDELRERIKLTPSLQAVQNLEFFQTLTPADFGDCTAAREKQLVLQAWNDDTKRLKRSIPVSSFELPPALWLTSSTHRRMATLWYLGHFPMYFRYLRRIGLLPTLLKLEHLKNADALSNLSFPLQKYRGRICGFYRKSGHLESVSLIDYSSYSFYFLR